MWLLDEVCAWERAFRQLTMESITPSARENWRLCGSVLSSVCRNVSPSALLMVSKWSSPASASRFYSNARTYTWKHVLYILLKLCLHSKTGKERKRELDQPLYSRHRKWSSWYVFQEPAPYYSINTCTHTHIHTTSNVYRYTSASLRCAWTY